MQYLKLTITVAKINIIIILALFKSTIGFAQNGTLQGDMNIQGIATSDESVPFWLRSNQFGAQPLAGYSGATQIRLEKNYKNSIPKGIDWGTGAEVRANLGTTTDLALIQGYAKLKLAMFEIRGGRWRQQIGLVDSVLSTGSFSISGNALGIPQVHISIPEFYPLPFTKGWFAIKGSLSHGWLGTIPIQGQTANVPEVNTYFHHKQLYGKLGAPNGKLHVYAGFNHQTFWGNERKAFGTNFDLTTWQAYQSVLYGKVWASSKVGNHLGSIDFGLGIRTANKQLLFYRQFFYEVGALAHMGNVTDGLNGISITNRNKAATTFKIDRIVIEYLNSMNQAGKLSSPVTPSGAENYYNHYLYRDGWSYGTLPIGNPLFTPVSQARPAQVASFNNYYLSNRLSALHLGINASKQSWKFSTLATYTAHYGLFSTGNEPYRTIFENIASPGPGPYFEKQNQFSGLLTVRNQLKKKTNKVSQYWELQLAYDNRGILNEGLGAIIKYGITIR